MNNDNNQINDNRVERVNDRKGRGLFYSVIAIATFIIMMVGATFAYFAASANSANNAIMTKSAKLQLTLYSYESAWSKNSLIPVDTDVVKYAFANQNDTTGVMGNVCYNESDERVDCSSPESKPEKQKQGFVKNNMCVDDYGNTVCSVYVFQVVNDNASPQTLSFSIVSDVNTFYHLYAGAYEVAIDDNSTYESNDSNNGKDDPTELTVKNGEATLQPEDYDEIYVNRKGVKKTLLSYTSSEDEMEPVQGEAIDKELRHVEEGDANDGDTSVRTVPVANGVSIGANETKTFAIILYIHNLQLAQVEDEDSKFQGSINVTTGDGATGVSGYISTVVQGRD